MTDGMRYVMMGLVAWCVGASAALAQESAVPGAGVDSSKWPDTDAVILEWNQSYELGVDGTVRRRDRQLVKLLNMRPVRQFADPRIDYCEGQDELIIHAARTILPDGKRVDVPTYSFNDAAADDVAGWPEYACWRQKVISFSAVQPGSVLELDYEVVTRPGVVPWISADIQLSSEYPILSRQVSLVSPDTSGGRSARVDGLSAAAYQASVDGSKYTWKFRDLPTVLHEAQALPWREVGARLRFTTAGASGSWEGTLANSVRNANAGDESIKRLAEGAAADEPDPMERVGKISQKLRDRFNFVNSPKTLRSWTCRPAAEVLRSNYGNPLESAALLLSLLTMAGFQAEALPAVDAVGWDETLPVDAAFAGMLVVVHHGGQEVLLHPQLGEIGNPGQWGRKWVLRGSDAGGPLYLGARGEDSPSDLNLAGKLVIAPDGKVSGEIRMRMTGVFFDPLKLKAADAQKKLVESMVGRVLSGSQVTSHSIVTLSPAELQATAQVATKEALKQVGGQFVLQFGAGPAFLPEIPLPLDRTLRRSKVRTAGKFREVLDLVVELPKEWPAPAANSSGVEAGGDWGTVAQELKPADRTVRLRRNIELKSDTLSPEDFAKVREAINTLRAVEHTNLVVGPKP